LLWNPTEVWKDTKAGYRKGWSLLAVTAANADAELEHQQRAAFEGSTFCKN
jgi:hypothetical protein